MRALSLSLILTALAAPAVAEEPLPTVKEITAHLDDLYRSTSSHAKMTMKVVTKHYSRSLDIEAWSVGDEHALMVIRQPAREAGTATLRTPDGLWNYAPRADRLVRIPSAMLSESWMGSHFTNDDLMRETSYDEDYHSEISRVEEGGKRYLKLTLKPKEKAAVVWSKIEWLLSEPGWLPVRADYYDGDTVVRRTHFRNVKELGGRKLPSEMHVVPTDEPEESTTVTYEALDLKANVDKTIFSPRGLRKVARQR